MLTWCLFDVKWWVVSGVCASMIRVLSVTDFHQPPRRAKTRHIGVGGSWCSCGFCGTLGCISVSVTFDDLRCCPQLFDKEEVISSTPPPLRLELKTDLDSNFLVCFHEY